MGLPEWKLDPKKEIEVNTRSGGLRDPSTGSTAEYRNGLWVLHLRGTPYQRGCSHGILLKEKIIDSKITEYYSSLLISLFNSSRLSRSIPGLLRKPVANLLERWIYSPLEKLYMEETRQELYGVADALGCTRQKILRGALAADIMEHLAASFLKGGKEALGNYYLGGCTGIYARKTALSGGAGAFFARNLDFPGALVWKYPCVIFAHPFEQVDTVVRRGGEFVMQRKTKQPYMYIATAGFPGHGLTGINASGVAMGSFVCISKNLSKRGLLFLDYNHYLFTRAEEVEGIIHLVEAENLVSTSPHAVVFADRSQAFSIEVDSSRSVVRTMPRDFDIHVQTNHYLNPLLKKKEMEFPLERENTIGRFRLIRDVLEENYGRIDLQRTIDIISCNLDLSSHTTRLVGDFPSQAITLTSAVFDLDTGNFWVADGKPPAVCYNNYRGFSFFDEIEYSGKNTTLRSYRRSDRALISESSLEPVTEQMKDSIKLLVLSQEELKIGKLREAVNNVEKAMAKHPDPGYRYILGILYLMGRRPDKALETLRSLRQSEVFPLVKSAALRLWEGRCLDLLDRRKEARECYLEALRDTSLVKHLRTALKKSLKNKFSMKQMPRSIDYHLLGPLRFY
ncbi:MAG: C45 family autoproteolytic acyltransferase/hydrolase [Spirochaetota bacterium]